MTADREAAIREALDGGVPLLHREDRMARRQKAEDALDSLLAELAAAREREQVHERLARAADAFIWDPSAENMTALRHARGEWQTKIGRMRLAAVRGGDGAA